LVFEGDLGLVVVWAGILINLGTEVGAADDAGMAIGIGLVSFIFEAEKWVACL
jgi:hypothetical protein